ncbi:alpha/beta fold hydrolase [Sphingomonas bacterium]|uniref:alpha/beta fold hydrolase n=1 Tax=Sphingomonas bacterium TaxID=1895847 RepID=UPI0026378EDE|nr:alpha/beta hydrolase [Sphingomonas bacterium]MDB5677197.1 lysophospholipase [Sphingomonas bacterium]
MTSAENIRRAYPPGSEISMWTAPDGWQLRRFDWPSAAAKPRGSILFQAGRGDLFEKYLETFHHWHDQGWSISSFDWRGQGGSGRLSDDPHVGDIDRFGTYLADFGAFWKIWAPTAPTPHVTIGHSMGGHLICRALAKSLAEPAAAVLVAPMMGVHAPISSGFGEWLANFAMNRGDPKRRAWKGNERPATMGSRQSLLTHDDDRYADEPWWWQAHPELQLGPPSWRWVVRAFESTRRLRLSRRVKLMKVPVLMLVADADKLVRAQDELSVAGNIPDCRVVRFGAESAHEILREVDDVRNRALGEIDIFLSARAQQ